MRDEKQLARPTARTRLARLVSAVIHPVLFPLVTVGILSWSATGHDARYGIEMSALGAVVTSLPVGILVAYKVLRGQWTDFDVSVRRQRYLLYPVGIALLLALAFVYRAVGAPPITVQAAVAATVTSALNAAINFVYKVSAHAASAATCAALLLYALPTVGAVAVLATLAVGWSRVALGRHTVGQVLLGYVVGALSVAVVLAFREGLTL